MLPKHPSGAVLPSAGSGRGDNNDLIQSMMKRITHLEQTNAELRVQIKSKSVKLENLESERFLLQSDAKPENVHKLKEIAKEKDSL